MSHVPESSLSLSQQLALCQQVARLVRSNLPIAGELSRLSAYSSDSHAAAAQAIDAQLVAGKSLTAAIAPDDSRDSRMLAASIAIGQRGGNLAQALEAWTELHLACSRYTKSLQAALVYPTLLVLVTLVSLGLVIWQLIPEYQATFVQLQTGLPVWLGWLVDIRERLGFLLGGLLLLAVAPLVAWYWHRRSFDAEGLPRDVSKRLRVQALSAELLQIGVAGELPLTLLIPWSVQASGGGSAAVEASFATVRRQALVPQLAREASMLIAALHGGVLSPEDTRRHLQEVAEVLRQQADERAARAARWLPMLVALTVGCLTILTYVFLIYLPWIVLLQRMVQP